MAKALSQVYTIIRGSVGGVTYLANQFHQIVVRARTAPVQPGTTPQGQMRSAFSAAEAQWRLASAIQQSAWRFYAQSVQYPGPLGNYTITGRLRFLGTLALASYLNSRFAKTITVSPVPPTRSGWFLISNYSLEVIGAVGTGFALQLTNDEEDDAVVLINVSPPQNNTRNFWKGPWDDNLTQAVDVAASSSLTHDIDGLVDGATYFVKIRVIGDNVNHRFSTTLIEKRIAAEFVI